MLPSLGIISKDASSKEAGEAQVNGDAQAQNGDAAEKKSKTIVIEDVKAFKAGMPLSAGAQPVKDLSEFEELGAKL